MTEGDDEARPGRITDEAVERLRGRIGKVFPIDEPYVRYVNRDSITHVLRALGDTNPLYADPEYAATTHHGRLVAPPAIFYAVAWGSWDLRRGQGLPGVHALQSADKWQYLRPVYDGDEIHATKELVKVDYLRGRLADTMILQTNLIRFFNQREEAVALLEMSVVRLEREKAKRSGKHSSRPSPVYTAEDIARIDAVMRSEIPRGAVPRYWDDVAVGEAVGPVVRGPLTVADNICWIQGMGSPHLRTGKYWLEYRERSPDIAMVDPSTGIPQTVERMHWDEGLAAEIGARSAYDYGAQRGATASYFASLWTGDDGWVAGVDVQYRGMVFTGDTYYITGQVEDVWRGARTGNGYVKVRIQAVNNLGEDVMPGWVTCALPTRHGGPVTFPVDVDADGRALATVP